MFSLQAPFKDGVHIIPQIPENSPEDQKELELRFNRVCATICQLIAEGNKALSNPIQQKKLLVEGTLNAPQILREKHSEKSQQMPYLPIRTESEPIPIKNSLPPTVTLSESSTKLSKVIVHAKLTPMILDDIFPEYPDLSNNLSSVSQSLQQRRRPSPQMLDSIYKKARNLITSRRTFLLHYPTTQQDLDEIDSYIMNNDTVQIPASLYTAFVEVVEGVHEDLVDAQQNNNYYYGDDRISGGGVNWRRDEIVAGGFSISAGKRATAVHVVVGKSGANVSDQAGGDDWTRRKNIVDFTSSAPSSSTLASRASRDESAVTVDRKVVSPTPLPTRRSVSAGGIRRPAAVTPVRSKLGSSGASAKSVVGNRSQRLPTLGSTTVQSYGDGP
ncbi:hypothetical protein HK100_000425 [Physocladia obscura]|uniref:Uncharacterized protein n=1 Tax=Physocladia obscura TaxID=109957 RepID=A0AAD5T4D9_9FUNG|nr:hypothetical protein HK100_000425 [Physocladia obscura]